MENEIPSGSARVVWEIDNFDDELDAAEDATAEQLALAHAKAVHFEHFHKNQGGWVYHVCVRGAWYAVDLEDDTVQPLSPERHRRPRLTPDPLGTVQTPTAMAKVCAQYSTTLLDIPVTVGLIGHPTTHQLTLCLQDHGVVHAYRDDARSGYRWIYARDAVPDAAACEQECLDRVGWEVEDLILASRFRASYTDFLLILLANRGAWVEAISSAHDGDPALEYYRITNTKADHPQNKYVYEKQDSQGRAVAWDHAEDAHLSFLVAGYSKPELPRVPVMTQKGSKS